MGRPIVIIAGQSNANTLSGTNGGATLGDMLAEVTPDGGIARLVFSDGAPMTLPRRGDDWHDAGELPAFLIQTIRLALQSHPDAYFGGILWIQGEGDTYANGSPDRYADRLTALLDRVERELADFGARAEGFRMSVLALSENAAAGDDRAQWDDLRAAQLRMDDPRINVIDPDRLVIPPGDMFKDDGLHYAPAANAPVLGALIDRLPLRLVGGSGQDSLSGGGATDMLDGAAGSDTLRGRSDNDLLYGRSGNDLVRGGWGDDTIAGGAGNDTLKGGPGADHFVFRAFSGTDVIRDFRPGRDMIDLRFFDTDMATAGVQKPDRVQTPSPRDDVWWYRSAGDTVLCLDRNADGRADVRVRIDGVTGFGRDDLLM
jgi:Ca2+-binding RTX toxin-like protein